VSVTVCLAPANTIAYPNGGGHLWVYLQWALGLRALGCRVIWLEVIDPTEPVEETARKVGALRRHLAPWGLAEAIALSSPDGAPLPRDVAGPFPDLEAAVDADLLLNLWHSLPAAIVRRFRRTALIDTDPGLLQIWMTTGTIRAAPHDTYFSIGETVGTPAARFPDCGLRWLYTPPPVFLPEWPPLPPDGAASYTTVAHWWGGTFEFNGSTFCNEKRVAFLEYLDLPTRAPVQLELAVCLAEYYEEYRQLMAPKGWTLREAWDVSSTPEQYRAYVHGSRGEFSCAKPAYVTLDTAWVSDRTLCYLASGRPAVVQHTGPSRLLPDADGLFRFRNIDDAVNALAAAEADYERHCRQARALAEEHFDARRVVASVLERALDRVAGATATVREAGGTGGTAGTGTGAAEVRDRLRRAFEKIGEPDSAQLCDVLGELIDGGGRVVGLRRIKARVYRLEIGSRPWRSVVLKRLEPDVAQRNRLVAERWLPALGLGDRCPRLLGAAAEPRGGSVWHVYEDLGDETLAARPDPERVAAMVDLVAELHTRAARHPVLPDVRHHGGGRGMPYFIANVCDAIGALDALQISGIDTPPEYADLAARMLERLRGLLADAPRRAQVFEEAAGPETLVHGDVWTINAFVDATRNGLRARLVDWDKAAVGPFSYDLSTLLFRFPPAERPGILERYRQAVARAGWRLASSSELSVLFDTAERARYANRVIWPALALLEERAEWGFSELAEVERWFLALDGSASH
jgi:phosphotransferase family enzyme